MVYRLNLAGTYEFFTMEDARRAADEGRLPPGAIVFVDGRTYVAAYYDDEKRMVLVKSPGARPPGDILPYPNTNYTLLPGPRHTKKGRK
jgi:hypothetical protein